MEELEFGLERQPKRQARSSRKRPAAPTPSGALRYPRRLPRVGPSVEETPRESVDNLEQLARQRQRPGEYAPSASALAAAERAKGAARDVFRTLSSGRAISGGGGGSAPVVSGDTSGRQGDDGAAGPDAQALAAGTLIKASVAADCSIKAFVEGALGVTRYVAGAGYHEFIGGTNIHTTDGWVVEHVASGEVYRGAEAVKAVGPQRFRRMNKAEPPSDLPPSFRLYLRSKSYARKLLKGSRFIYDLSLAGE